MACEILLYLLVAIPYLKAGITNLEINTDKAVNVISDKFLSVAIDIAHLRSNLATISLPKLMSLAKALSPCYVRVGGTQADFMKFSPSTEDHEDSQHDGQYDNFSSNPNEKPLINMAISEGQRDKLNRFVAKVGWSIIFDLNSLLRKNGNWSPENAQLLLNYSTRRGYKIAGWKLGNEPDAYEHRFGYDITASQRAEDYLKIHGLLNQ